MRMRSNRLIHVSVVAVVLAVVAAALYLEAYGLRRHPLPPVVEVPDGDPELGRAAIIQHGCGSCHVIPGIRTATGRVGPQLVGFREQIYIAGVLANSPDRPENLIGWIQYPEAVNPATAMPNLGVSESEARHIAAYLYNMP